MAPARCRSCKLARDLMQKLRRMSAMPWGSRASRRAAFTQLPEPRWARESARERCRSRPSRRISGPGAVKRQISTPSAPATTAKAARPRSIPTNLPPGSAIAADGAGLNGIRGLDRICGKRIGNELKALIEGETRRPAVPGKCACLFSRWSKREPERRIPHEPDSIPQSAKMRT